MEATISADIVSSTSFTPEEVVDLKKNMERFFSLLENEYSGLWGRQIKGDYFEFYIPDASNAFRVALLLKTYLKSFNAGKTIKKNLFQTYGARIAIGIGKMRIVDRISDIMDGEAIYLSGRKIDEITQLTKGTLFINTNISELHDSLLTLALLTDAIINSASQKQCEVIYYKLLSKNEKDIAQILNIKQSGVNQRSTSGNWFAIESAVRFYEHIKFKDYE
jgi:hypothetical protein